jgi:hypothetical protein
MKEIKTNAVKANITFLYLSRYSSLPSVQILGIGYREGNQR